MATLYIAEFAFIPRQTGDGVQIAQMAPIAEQTVAIGAGSTASSAFNAATRFIRLHTDSICSIAFGASPTATTTNARMAANTTEYFAVTAAQKVAVISNT